MSQFLKHKIGMLGLSFLTLFTVISILSPVIAVTDPKEWYIAPRMVPPSWTQYVGSGAAPEGFIEITGYTSKAYEKLWLMNVTIKFRYDYEVFPKSFTARIKVKVPNPEGVPKELARVLAMAYIKKPGGEEISLMRETRRLEPGTEVDILISSRDKDLKAFLNVFYELNATNPDTEVFPQIIFFADFEQSSSPYNSADSVVEKGLYEVTYSFTGFTTKDIEVKEANVKIEGVVYGLMGSDGEGRDVWSMLVWGAPIALVIGLSASILSTVLGMVYGIVSGYAGGRLDEVMMRIVDILIAIPKLPLLIIIAYLHRPSVWTIVFLIGFLGWMGISRVARSMTLQLKEMTFIEASKVLGARGLRIIFRHIMPNILPYAYASIALGVPDAILTEASLSFLGLGDPTAPTWGLMLYWARIDQAFFKGAWWTVIPPGLAITLLSVSFVFTGHAMDEILNPRIKRL